MTDHTEGAPAPVMAASSAELGQAVAACDFPIVVWVEPSATILLANEAAAGLLGVPLDHVIGLGLREVIDPHQAFEITADALRSGAIDSLRAERLVRRPSGGAVEVSVWTRAIDVDGQRGAVTLLVPEDELPRLGRDPAEPWRDLAAIAVGTAHGDWRIASVSADIANVLGGAPSDWAGSSLRDVADPRDRHRFAGFGAGQTPSGPQCQVRLRRRDGSWVDVCILVAPLGLDHPGMMAFALIAAPDRAAAPGADRVAELEMRLRRIGAEVRAAGVLGGVGALPSASDFPQLAELSTRQWEILSRLVRGDRVPTIAAALFISPSTVRNHLAAIFQKFGVHSQDALLRLLRQSSPAHA